MTMLSGETTQDYIERDPPVSCEGCNRLMMFRPTTVKKRRPLPFADYCTDCTTPLIAFFDEKAKSG